MNWTPPDWMRSINTQYGLAGIVIIVMLLVGAHLLGVIDISAFMGL